MHIKAWVVEKRIMGDAFQYALSDIRVHIKSFNKLLLFEINV